MLNDLITVTEAAAIWGLNTSTIRYAIRYGRITDCKKVGNTWLINRSELIKLYGEPSN